MTQVKINIQSRQIDGEDLNYKTDGELTRKDKRVHLSFSLKTVENAPPSLWKIVFWREGLAVLKTRGETGYTFRLEEGADTTASFSLGGYTFPITVKTELVRLKDFSTHGNLHLRYQLYSGGMPINENDVLICWEDDI